MTIYKRHLITFLMGNFSFRIRNNVTPFNQKKQHKYKLSNIKYTLVIYQTYVRCHAQIMELTTFPNLIQSLRDDSTKNLYANKRKRKFDNNSITEWDNVEEVWKKIKNNLKNQAMTNHGLQKKKKKSVKNREKPTYTSNTSKQKTRYL